MGGPCFVTSSLLRLGQDALCLITGQRAHIILNVRLFQSYTPGTDDLYDLFPLDDLNLSGQTYS